MDVVSRAENHAQSTAEGREEDDEFQRPKSVRFHDEQIYPISKEEREEHELLGHVQYRSWCRHCAAAQGVGQPHRQLGEDPVDATVPEIVLDYFFMGEESETAPHIVVKDRKSNAYFSTSLDSKTSQYAVAFVAGAILELGYKRILMKSDNEPSIKRLKERVSKCLPGVECVPKEAPVGDSRANGSAENAVKQVKGQFGTLKTSTEDRYGCKIDAKSCLIAWIPRHCANLMTRFKQYSDGRTAIQRLTGRRWGRPMVVFGERILVKVAAPRAARCAGLESTFVLAVYVGHHGRSGALMALTEHGAVNARSFKRLPESDRFIVSELEKLKGLPWNLLGSLDAERLDKPLITGLDAMGIPILPVPASMPPLLPKAQERRMYVTSADVRKYGGSGGCQACAQVYICGRTNVPHSDACRRRIQELMKGDDAGRARLDASRKRKASSREFERDAPLMPGVRQELKPGDRSLRQEESTRHGGGDVEIPAAHGSGDKDQSRAHASWSGGAASSSDQGLKRTAGQAGLPEDEDISHPQGTKRTVLESTGSGLEPDARRLRIAGRTDPTTRNDADFDIQVTEANMPSADDPPSGSNSLASMCWREAQHVRRDQVVDAFRSDFVDIGERERGVRDFISIVGGWICHN